MLRQESCVTRILQLGKIFVLLLIPLAIVPILSGRVGEITKHWVLGTKVLSSTELWMFFWGLLASSPDGAIAESGVVDRLEGSMLCARPTG